jgi:hypothetical protein
MPEPEPMGSQAEREKVTRCRYLSNHRLQFRGRKAAGADPDQVFPQVRYGKPGEGDAVYPFAIPLAVSQAGQ